MTLKTLAAASAILLSATTFAFTQNLPNYGANAPSTCTAIITGTTTSGTNSRPPEG